MLSTDRRQRILLPVKGWFIWLSLAVAIVLNLLPPGQLIAYPDWVALVLAFWCANRAASISAPHGCSAF
jgi:rod shape-determining protein MreD